MSESNLYNAFRRQVSRLQNWDHERHEDKFKHGIPDVSFAHLGRHGWIELKHVKKIKADGTFSTGLREDQCEWLEDRGEAGGNCWMLIQVTDHGYFLVPWNHLEFLTEDIPITIEDLRQFSSYHFTKWDVSKFSGFLFED